MSEERLPRRQPSDRTGELGVLFCSTVFVENGWAFRPQDLADYGIDGHAELCIGDLVTGRLIALQIKSGPSWFNEPTDTPGWIFRSTETVFNYWLGHSLPVIVVLVDEGAKTGYWEVVTEKNVASTGKGRKIEIPQKQQLNAEGLARLGEIARTAPAPDRVERFDVQPDDKVNFATEDFEWLPAQTPDGTRYDLYPKAGTGVPPRVSFEILSESIEQMRLFQERGVGGTVHARVLDSNFLPPSFISNGDAVELRLADRKGDRVYPVVLQWDSDSGEHFERQFPLMVTRAGTKEVTLETTPDQADYVKFVVDGEKKSGSMQFTFHIAGMFVRRAYENADFLVKASREKGRVKLKSVETGLEIFASSFSYVHDDNAIPMRDLLGRCVAIQDRFKRALRVPEDGFSDVQARGIWSLAEIIRSGKEELGNCAVSLPVDQPLAQRMREELDGSANLAFRPEQAATFELLGESFHFGMRTLVIIEPVLMSEEPHQDDSEQGLVLVTVKSKVGIVRLYYDDFKQQQAGEDLLLS